MRLKIEPNEQMRTTIIRIVEKEAKEKLLKYVYDYKQWENMIVILIEQNYQLFKEKKTANDFKYLSSYQVMRAVIRDTPGGKDQKKADYIKEKYKDNELMKQIIELGKKLKIHNVAMVLSSIKGNFRSFFTKIKKGFKDARPPQPKKLCKVSQFSIPLDMNAWSFNHQDEIALNLSDHMFYLPLNHEKLIDIVADLENIQSVLVHMRNKEIYLNISYRYKTKTSENSNMASQKEAGLDVGVNNLASFVVNDEKTPSLIVAGNNFKH